MKARTWGPGWSLVAVWVLTSAIILLLQSWLFEVGFLIALASLPLLLMIGIGLLVFLLAMKAWKATLAFLAATIVIGFLPLNAMGHQAWTRISFAQHRATYEKVVARATALPAHGTVDGAAYRKDQGRIAFPRSEGMPDGWSAVIYDPADALPLADGPRLSAFGSQILSCIRIERHWYRCWLD